MKEFWGIELKLGKPHCFRLRNDEHRKLIVTTATLGEGLGKEKSVLQCSIGDSKRPVDLCALLPKINEACSLTLLFDHYADSVEFSVIGDRSIYLNGYWQHEKGKDVNSGGVIIEKKEDFQDKGKDVNLGVEIEEEEEAKSFKRFWRDSIKRKRRYAPPGSCLRGRLYQDILPPTFEERYRLYRILRKQLAKTNSPQATVCPSK
ncbi:hypothetical protein ISN45_Aa06g001600 [Arabidopsis thaliana x Arabidopsis arenosa]|uniref:peptidylprolyl isomerase n=1 Tax=Arabidopsis thaliana x Arabidopsis arenosa TaxID=1240361 RepID=A0A8T1YS10_9BRAS|nr:hypothetical protein ISN45_Aa06g001600 [Arabidopsis thaliana x Arabidopsis arenosa]